jgi:hypothetical protein
LLLSIVPGEATLPASALAALRAFDENLTWAKAHSGEITKHREQYVAVLDGRLVGVAGSDRELRDRFPGRLDLYVAFVPPADVAWVG